MPVYHAVVVPCVHGKSRSTSWRQLVRGGPSSISKYVQRLENLFTAMNITPNSQKRALNYLYICWGRGVWHLRFNSCWAKGGWNWLGLGLVWVPYDKSKTALNDYFNPKKNTEYEIYQFRQAKQNVGESLDAYHHTRLRRAPCCYLQFWGGPSRSRTQIAIRSCLSSRLRCCALRPPWRYGFKIAAGSWQNIRNIGELTPHLLARLSEVHSATVWRIS